MPFLKVDELLFTFTASLHLVLSDQQVLYSVALQMFQTEKELFSGNYHGHQQQRTVVII